MTAKRKLIRRNAHKMIAKIFEDSTTAKVYTLNNGFVGEPVAVEWVKKHTANIDHAEHYDNLNGTYTIRIHSNLWYEMVGEKELPPFCKTCSDVGTCYDPERCDAWLDWVSVEVIKLVERPH